MCLRTLAKFCAIGLSVFVLAACGGGSSSPSTPETGNTISVFGSDGPMAGADVAVYDLQAYLDNSTTAESLLAAPAMTDAVTALADDLELSLDAGLGPYMVVVTANATTTDLSTGVAPVISEVKTIVTSLSDARIYATPLTTIAVAIASEGEATAADVIGNLVAAENTAQAFFGFGMDRTIDIFTASPVLDESTTTVEKQQEVAQYRGASEALATLVDDGALDFAAVVADAADGTLEPAVVTAVQGLDVLDVLARVSVASIADLLDADATGLADYDIDVSVDEAPSGVIDSDVDGANNVDDNCPADVNADQSDIDTDTIGDVCDPDIDGDSVLNGDDAFPNDPAETTDTDSDGTGDNADAFPNDPAETTDTDSDGTGDNADAFPNDPAEDTDSDSDGTGDNADAFPNDPAETTDTDSDGTGDNGDNCPTDANADQSDIDTDTIGDVCDPDIDGDGTLNEDDADPTDPNISVDLDSDGIDDSTDNCLGLSNNDQADIDNDDVGDACDSDKDGDTLANGVDPDELNSESTYHFDFFYNQLSSDTGAFKAAAVGETVTQADGTVDIGTGVDSTTLDLGSDETGNGSFDVRADYATTEESLSYTGTDFSTATPTFTDATVSTDNLGNTVALSNGVLSFTDETPAVALTAWGQHNYIGSGRVTLNGASTTLATAEEQALSVLSFADGNSDDADLNADYGVVIMDTVYGDDPESATIEELVNLFTSVGTFNFDGAGALTLSNGSNYLSGLGETDGAALFSTGLPAPTGTYTVSPSGAVELVIDGESLYGFADSEGDLITLSDPASRIYGVKLGTDVTNADLADAAFDLQGLVIDSSNVTLKASTYLGGVAKFSADGTTLDLSGSITSAVAAFSDSALPSVTTASEALSLTSNAITIADNGRLSPITFTDSGLELEGFLTKNGGLLLRVVDMVSVTSGGTGGTAGLQVGSTFFPLADAPFNGALPQICDEELEASEDCAAFRNVVEADTVFYVGEDGSILFGTWVEGGSGGGASTTLFTSDVRAGSGPDLEPIAADTEVTITQGILFGTAVAGP
ncbi:thrombospondin type 3 repeat-containing protein [Pseudomonadales bacterium]|nr:thrombospondin type 3 repeat-containing protein [Pseudomonadales bacterium]